MPDQPTPTHTWMVRLTPCDTFFFGRSTYTELANPQSYFAFSDTFPQQTSLLGLLRFQLLRQEGLAVTGNGRLKPDPLIQTLIGPQSFPSPTGYGVIRGLSPVFLWRQEEDAPYFLRAFEFIHEAGEFIQSDLNLAGSTDRSYALVSETKRENSIKFDSAYSYAPFFQKTPLVSVLESPKTGTKRLLEEVILPCERDHNNKSIQGTSLDGGRFKERSFRMARNFSFAFFVQLAKPYVLADDFVRLGGRRSRFKLQAIEVPASSWEDNLEPWHSPGSKKFLLLSDARLRPDYRASCKAVFGEVTPFRHHRTMVDSTANYYGLPDFSSLQYLLQRGSVLYLKDKARIQDLQDDQAALFADIGYNAFLPIAH